MELQLHCRDTLGHGAALLTASTPALLRRQIITAGWCLTPMGYWLCAKCGAALHAQLQLDEMNTRRKPYIPPWEMGPRLIDDGMGAQLALPCATCQRRILSAPSYVRYTINARGVRVRTFHCAACAAREREVDAAMAPYHTSPWPSDATR